MAGLTTDEHIDDAHRYVHDHLRIRTTNPQVARHAFYGSGVFRFAVVRNPWNRLVSAFANKLVKPDTYHTLKNAVALFQRPKLFSRSKTMNQMAELLEQVTFRQFVNQITCRPAHAHDLHWWPQHMFMADIDFDLIGYFEHMQDLASELSSRTGLAVNIKKLNTSSYTDSHTPVAAGEFADTTIQELRQLQRLPKPEEFYTDDLVCEVSEYYQEDIERFGYEYSLAPSKLFAA